MNAISQIATVRKITLMDVALDQTDFLSDLPHDGTKAAIEAHARFYAEIAADTYSFETGDAVTPLQKVYFVHALTNRAWEEAEAKEQRDTAALPGAFCVMVQGRYGAVPTWHAKCDRVVEC